MTETTETQPRANQTVDDGVGSQEKPRGGSTLPSQPRDPASVGLAGITTEQWHNLLDLLNLPKPKDRVTGERVMDY